MTTNPDAWREEPVSELTALHGLRTCLVDRLFHCGIHTLGELDTHCKTVGLTVLWHIGPKSAKEIKDALRRYMANH